MLLALDTASSTTGIALRDGYRLIAEKIWQSKAHHTVELAPEVAVLLQRAGVRPGSLTGIAVASGPGSYTGLRIGMALAKGLALAHKIPLISVPTLDILAQGQPPMQAPMLALMKAGRGRFVGQLYRHRSGAWKSAGKPANMTWETLLETLEAPTYVAGYLERDQRETLRKMPGIEVAAPALCVRRPGVLADMAWTASQRQKPGKNEAADQKPTYLGSIKVK